MRRILWNSFQHIWEKYTITLKKVKIVYYDGRKMKKYTDEIEIKG